MKTYENNNGNMSLNANGNICSLTEFVRETDEEDGTTLMVVNESSYTVDRYCVAFNGHWIDL